MQKENQKEVAESSQKTAKETKFRLDELKRNCLKMFGVTSSTFAGATASLKKDEYTIQEVRQCIEAWKKKEVR